MLYQYLAVEDITDLDAMLAYFNNTTDSWAWSRLDSYKQGKMTQQFVLDQFEYDKSQIEKYMKVQKKLKKKLKKLK